MSERVEIGRRRALTAVVALAMSAALGWAVPTSASAVGPTTGGPTIRLSVVPRTTALTARQTGLSVLARAGLTAAAMGPAHPVGRAYQLDVPTSQLAATLSALRASGSVQSVEPVHAMSLLDVPDDSFYAQQATYLKSLDLPKAWDVTHGSASVKVAVIDSGAQVNHQDLAGKVVARYNAVTGTQSVTDTVGHGTMVASMIGAHTDNAEGVAGAGWNSHLMVVKVADRNNQINDADVAEGVDWAVAHGAQVINLSLGGPGAGTSLRDAIARAVHSDVVVVAAAGNDGTTNKFYPAALPGVVAVGATTRGGSARTSFSQYGSWVDVGAPGVDILGASASAADAYESGDGTSFASPLVAGVAALIRASRPELTAAQVDTAMTATASTTRLGFAHGRVDAYKALGYHLVLGGPAVSTTTAGDGDLTIDATVGGAVHADHVKAWIVGRSDSAAAALSDGAATLHLPTWGSAGSRTLRVVACRQTLCSSSGTDVPIVVRYAAPILTAPGDGDHQTAGWTAAATAAAPAVRFLADGKTLATDTSAPFSAAVALAKLANGSHAITAVSCDSSGSRCDTSNASAAATITVDHLTPTITSLSPTVISPNGDGAREHTRVEFSLEATADVTMRVTNSNGATVRSVSLGKRAAGAYVWYWNGANDSGHVVSGTYVVHLDAVGEPPLTGTAAKTVRVDLTRPTVSSVSSTYATVYPHSDGFRDSTYLSARISEAGRELVRVTNAKNVTVWSAHVSQSSPATVKVKWRGTSSAGHRLPAGTYRVRWTSTDRAGNVTNAPSKKVGLSARFLVRRTWTRTVTAQGASGGQYQSTDASSTVQVFSSYATGALRFRASSTGAVRTVNHLTLPAATVYSSIAVGTYGRGVNGGQAFFALLDTAGHEVHGKPLSSSAGTHSGGSVAVKAGLLAGRTAHWELLVQNGDTYDVRTYTVTLTYRVLS